jgi:D-amino peptidase
MHATRRIVTAGILCASVRLCTGAPLAAQQPAAAPATPAANQRIPQPRPMPAYPRLPAPVGFRVFFIPDLEGMGSVVFNRDITAGNETSAGRENALGLSQHADYWAHYRDLATQEVNAAITGARRGGARSFVVNEGHGGNLFANILPWELDTAALLIRGWPKPEVMSTGMDSSVGALIMTGVHAGPRTAGIIAHAYAFDSIIVNGHWLNETGFNALVASEFGVPIVMVTGDNVAMQQAREQLGPNVVLVTTKIAIGGSAGVTWSPAVVRQMMRDSAALAVRRAMRGEIQPFRLQKPYEVDLVLRRSYPANFAEAVDSIPGFPGFRKTGDHTYHMTTSDAREIARLFDVIEGLALR